MRSIFTDTCNIFTEGKTGALLLFSVDCLRPRTNVHRSGRQQSVLAIPIHAFLVKGSGIK